jgi:hypothetical protein
MDTKLSWIIIFLCIIQSGLTAGLTLGLFGFPRLRLEAEAEAGNLFATKILKLRSDANYLLSTLIWANVCVNALLAFLTEAIMNGLLAFIVTTFCITFFGEIIPQAYISRNALRVSALFTPLVKFYGVIFFPLAKPTSFLLDLWLGEEGHDFMQEETLKVLLMRHVEDASTEIDKLEGHGAINFLSLDDIYVKDEGEVIHPDSIIQLEERDGHLIFPEDLKGIFASRLSKLTVKWAILINARGFPVLLLEVDRLLKDLSHKFGEVDPYSYCHYPVVVTNPGEVLANAILKLWVEPESEEDDVIDKDTIIYWSDEKKKIITGSDLLGRLLRGIVKKRKVVRLTHPPD